MSRLYTGDISGKFLTGIQSSYAPQRFGGEELEPTIVRFGFCEGYLDSIKDEIKSIKKQLGPKLAKINEYFKKNDNSWNDTIFANLDITQKDLCDWADLKLGQEILKKVNEQGYCTIECEL